jgi:hypothetical protein
MIKFLILNTFKTVIDDRRSFVIFKSGEEYSLDALSVYFNEKSIESLIETNHIQKLIQNAGIDLNPIEATQGIDLKPIEEIEQPAFEIVYKTTQPIQDKDGNEIEVGSQFTESELKEKGFGKKTIAKLLKEEKLIEIKKLPQ